MGLEVVELEEDKEPVEEVLVEEEHVVNQMNQSGDRQLLLKRKLPPENTESRSE